MHDISAKFSEFLNTRKRAGLTKAKNRARKPTGAMVAYRAIPANAKRFVDAFLRLFDARADGPFRVKEEYASDSSLSAALYEEEPLFGKLTVKETGYARRLIEEFYNHPEKILYGMAEEGKLGDTRCFQKQFLGMTVMPERWSKSDCDEFMRTGKLPPSASHNGVQPSAIVDVAVSDAEDYHERVRQEIVIVRETGVALLSVLRVGQALRIIKERKLYRSMTVIRDGKPITVDGYDTLEQYTKSRFGFDKSRRAQALNLAQVFIDLDLDEKSTTGRLLTLTERSFRPFYRLDTKQRREAWKEIKAVSGEHIAPGTIAKTVNRLYPNPKKKKEYGDFPSEELIDKWIGKFISRYPKRNWDGISEVIDQRNKYFRNELVEAALS